MSKLEDFKQVIAENMSFRPGEKRRLIELHVPPGKQESRGKYEPLPDGPYVLIRQNEEEHFLVNYLNMNLVFQPNFELKWGYITYAVEVFTGNPIVAGYWLDTSG